MMNGMKRMLSYRRRYRPAAIGGALMKAAATVLLLLLPRVLEKLVDEAVPSGDARQVLLWGGVMVLIALVERSMNLWSSRIAVRVAKGCIYEIRRDLFARSVGLSGEQLDSFGLPSLTGRLTNDAYNVQGFLQLSLTFMIRAPILVLGSLALTLRMDPPLALVLLGAAAAMVAAVAIVSVRGVPLYARVQRDTDRATRILREDITGIRVIRALVRERREERRFDEANAALAASDRRAGTVMSLPGPVTALMLDLGLVLVVVLGAGRVDRGLIRPGVILAFLTWFNFLLMGVLGLNRVFLMLSKAAASAGRIAAVLNAPEALPVLPETETAGGDALLAFERVSFRYAGSGGDSLTDISFSLKRGGTLGIIGPTGCGKTTILQLLMRFYDPTEGRVLVDGKDARSYAPDTLRKKFGAVFQNDIVFADSLEENISFGRDVDEAARLGAAEAAGALEFIAACEGGWRHRAAARGADLSGGQRQRLLIARALAGRPEILLLDDASSALDYRTDAAVRKAVRERYGAAAAVIVAQRINSIMDCDEILVLDEGRVTGRGTHRELLQSCPQYREIHDMQMGEVV